MNQGRLDEAVDAAFVAPWKVEAKLPRGALQSGQRGSQTRERSTGAAGRLPSRLGTEAGLCGCPQQSRQCIPDPRKAGRGEGLLRPRALNLKPDLAEAHVNRSFLRLLQGDFERWLAGLPVAIANKKPQPPEHSRTSTSLFGTDGRSRDRPFILLHAEQGLGDVLQFIRYVPWVQECGGTVVVECPGSLVSLLANCPNISRVSAEGEPATAV